MMLHLLKQRFCALILKQIWENKAKQPLSVEHLHTFVCLSAAIQIGPFKIKSFRSIPFSRSCWTRGLAKTQVLLFAEDMRLWRVYDWTFSSFGVLSQLFFLLFKAKSAVYDGRGLIMDISSLDSINKQDRTKTYRKTRSVTGSTTTATLENADVLRHGIRKPSLFVIRGLIALIRLKLLGSVCAYFKWFLSSPPYVWLRSFCLLPLLTLTYQHVSHLHLGVPALPPVYLNPLFRPLCACPVLA